MASAASKINERPGATSGSLLTLPDEILSKVLALVSASKVPVHLQHFLDVGQKLGESCSTVVSASIEDRFLDELHMSQKEHYLDWIMANGVCRRLRACGLEAFFSTKSFMIALPLLKSIEDESVTNLSSDSRAAVLSSIRHVIVPLPTYSVASHVTRLPVYNAFQRIRILSLQPAIRDDSDLFQFLEIVATYPRRPPGPYLRIVKQHPAPQDLVNLLQGIGLDVARFKVNLLVDDSDERRRLIIDDLGKQVYSYLRFLGEQKAKRRKADIQDSSTSQTQTSSSPVPSQHSP
ncbi:MAG: hypothetical protein Q9217_004389 [Psora testacea]